MFYFIRSRTQWECKHFKTHRKYFCKINKAFIDGVWVDAKSGKTMKVTSPVDDRIVGCVPNLGLADVELALSAASKAFKTWQWTLARDRSKLLRRWCELVVRDKEKLAQVITSENGKPICQARLEVDLASSYIEWFADSARHMYGEVVPSPWRRKEIIMTRQAIGVISIITPWNCPFSIIARKTGAALATGCTCVIKPSEEAPLVALAAVKLSQEAGIPDGVLNVVTSCKHSSPSVVKLMCQSTMVAGISFTGSTEIGKILFSHGSVGVKRLTLELGGNAPFIVFKTADMDNVIRCAMSSKFKNNGQSCFAANKFLIHQSVYNEFISRFANEIRSKLVLGDSTKEDVNVGPLANCKQLQRMLEFVEDAVKKGACIETGGCAAKEYGDKYYRPTLMTGVSRDMRVYREEIYGPIAPCIMFRSDEEALRFANDTYNRLISFIFSNDLTQVQDIVPQLQFGAVGVNESFLYAPEPAIGGVREGGMGREGGMHGLDEYTYFKYTLLCGDH